MKVNGIDIKSFNARLISKTLESSECNIGVEWPEKSLYPFIEDGVHYKFKKLKLEVEFKGNFAETNLNKSKFYAEIARAVITDIGLNPNTLTGYLTSQSVKLENGYYQVMIYELNVIEEMPQVTVALDFSSVKSLHINNRGTGYTPAVLKFTDTQSRGNSVSFNYGSDEEIYINLNNLTAGVTRVIGTEVGVFEGSVNKFSDVVLKNFPKLRPGDNLIAVGSAGCKVDLIYKPRII